jgi:hypothetical protein
MNRIPQTLAFRSATAALAGAVLGVTLGAAALAPTPALAQGSALPPRGEMRTFGSLSALYQFDTGLDRGGDYGSSGAIARAGVSAPFGERLSAGITLAYDYTSYRFDAPVAFGGSAPWDSVQRVGFSVPVSYVFDGGWFGSAVASVDWFRENGASWGDSLTYGATLSGGKVFAPGKRLGLGVGVFSRIEETSVFPFLLVDWPLTDRLRLTNPLAAGPTGPAGLELRYALADGWEVGGGAAYRSTRFRLDGEGLAPNGVGEEKGVPVFFHAVRRLTPTIDLNFHAGVVVGGRLTVEDSGGSELARDEFSGAPLLAVTISGRF